MKLPRVPLAGAILGVALLLAGCANVANPEGWAAPVFDPESDRFIVLLDSDRLAAVTIEDGVGTIDWEFPDDQFPGEEDVRLQAVYTDPIIDGDLIYVGDYDGDLYAIGRDDGRLVWSTEGRLSIDGSIVGGPAQAGDQLIFGTTEGILYSVSTSEGTPSPNWPEDGASLSNKGIWAPPVVVDDRVFVATMDGKVRALDVATGEEVWGEPFEGDRGAIAELVQVGDSLLFAPTLGKDVFLIDTESGQPVGEPISAEDWIWTRPAVADGVAYFGDFGGVLVALDITTQEIVWRQETDDRVKAGPAVVGDFVVFADESPAIIFVNRETGTIRNRVPLADAGTIRASITEQDGAAYAITTNGKIFRADPERFSAVQVPVSEGNP